MDINPLSKEPLKRYRTQMACCLQMKIKNESVMVFFDDFEAAQQYRSKYPNIEMILNYVQIYQNHEIAPQPSELTIWGARRL